MCYQSKRIWKRPVYIPYFQDEQVPDTSKCEAPISPVNGSFTLTNTTDGATSSLECDYGFTPSGELNITCNSSGVWSSSNYSCNPVGMCLCWFLVQLFSLKKSRLLCPNIAGGVYIDISVPYTNYFQLVIPFYSIPWHMFFHPLSTLE